MTRPDDEALLDSEAPPVEVRGLISRFGPITIHDNLDLVVRAGRNRGGGWRLGHRKICAPKYHNRFEACRGGVRENLRPGHSLCAPRAMDAINRRWGVLFQQGALWSNLTVKENVAAPLFEHTDMLQEEIDELADSEDRTGRAAARRRGAETLRTLRRHDKTRQPGARPGAGSGIAFPR